mmetsp:Transcript_32106/g.106265  ORF Transcript_32106/g.106265 Transcript_32106/m.106265 type:complete len:89 (-) Transcript_32106:154-420(-)
MSLTVLVCNMAGDDIFGPASLRQPLFGSELRGRVHAVVSKSFKLVFGSEVVSDPTPSQVQHADQDILVKIVFVTCAVVTWGDADYGGD